MELLNFYTFTQTANTRKMTLFWMLLSWRLESRIFFLSNKNMLFLVTTGSEYSKTLFAQLPCRLQILQTQCTSFYTFSANLESKYFTFAAK